MNEKPLTFYAQMQRNFFKILTYVGGS